MAKLRLSHAILLGDSLKKGNADRWLNEDGSCGCALGGALLATGATPAQFFKELGAAIGGAYERFTELPLIKARWPWLTKDAIIEISAMYAQVRLGNSTIEAIAAYADSIDPTPRIEPPVQEPAQVEVRQESTQYRNRVAEWGGR